VVGLQSTNEASDGGHYSCLWGGSWCGAVAVEHGYGSDVNDTAEADEQTHGHAEVDHVDSANARALGMVAAER